MLAAPRALLAWAPALLDAPPKVLVFRDVSPLGIVLLPILVPLPLLRFELALLRLALEFEPVRFAVEVPEPLGFTPAFEAGRFAAAALRLVVPGC